MNTIETWWQTTGLNLSHHDACAQAFKLGASEAREAMQMALVCLEDHNLAPFIQEKLRESIGKENGTNTSTNG